MENMQTTGNQWGNSDSPESMKEKRGSFLLVISILSWVFIGFSIFSTAIGYFNGVEKLQTQIDLSIDQMDTDTGNAFADNLIAEAIEVLEKTITHFESIQLVTMVSLLIGALSVYLMFQLKKMGYLLYIVYTMLYSSISFYFLGSSMVVWLGQGLYLFIGIVFLILYGVNLKRMTK